MRASGKSVCLKPAGKSNSIHVQISPYEQISFSSIKKFLDCTHFMHLINQVGRSFGLLVCICVYVCGAPTYMCVFACDTFAKL